MSGFALKTARNPSARASVSRADPASVTTASWWRAPDEGAEYSRCERVSMVPARLRREAEERAIEGHARGDPGHRRGMAAVEHGERRPRTRLRLARGDGRREQLGKEARSTHAAPHDMVELVALEVAREGEQGVDLSLHPLRLAQPTEAVRDVGRVVLPEGVVARVEPGDGSAFAEFGARGGQCGRPVGTAGIRMRSSHRAVYGGPEQVSVRRRTHWSIVPRRAKMRPCEGPEQVRRSATNALERRAATSEAATI